MTPDALPAAPRTLDLTGLSEAVARDIVRLVETLRGTVLPPAAARLSRPPLMGRFADPARPIPEGIIEDAQAEVWATFPRDLSDPVVGT